MFHLGANGWPGREDELAPINQGFEPEKVLRGGVNEPASMMHTLPSFVATPGWSERMKRPLLQPDLRGRSWHLGHLSPDIPPRGPAVVEEQAPLI